MGILPDDDPDCPDDDLAITPEHAKLYLAEERRFQRFLRLSVEVSGVPAQDHIVAVVSLLSRLGRTIGESVIGAPLVEYRLREAALHGVRPSFSVPYPINEALSLVALLGPEGVDRVMARPPGTLPVAIWDEHENLALIFLAVPPQPAWGVS